MQAAFPPEGSGAGLEQSHACPCGLLPTLWGVCEEAQLCLDQDPLFLRIQLPWQRGPHPLQRTQRSRHFLQTQHRSPWRRPQLELGVSSRLLPLRPGRAFRTREPRPHVPTPPESSVSDRAKPTDVPPGEQLWQGAVCPSLAPRGLSPKTPKPGKPSEEECVPSHAIGHTPTLGCQTTGQLDPELLQDPGPQGGRLLKGTCARSSVAGKPSPFTHPVLPPGHKSPEDRTQLLRRQRLCAPPSSDWATAHQGPLPAPPPGGPGEGPGELKAQRSQAGQVGAENTWDDNLGKHSWDHGAWRLSI